MKMLNFKNAYKLLQSSLEKNKSKYLENINEAMSLEVSSQQ